MQRRTVTLQRPQPRSHRILVVLAGLWLVVALTVGTVVSADAEPERNVGTRTTIVD